MGIQSVRVGSLNIRRGFETKKFELQELAEKNNLHMLALQETDLEHIDEKCPPNIGGFTAFYNKNDNRSKTRSLIFVCDDLASFCEVIEPCKERSHLVQTTWISVNIPDQKSFYLCSFYREWLKGDIQSQVEALQVFKNQVSEISGRDRSVLIVGDFNLDAHKWRSQDYQWRTLSEDWLSFTSVNNIQQVEVGSTFPLHP